MVRYHSRHGYSTPQDIAVMYGMTVGAVHGWIKKGIIHAEHWEGEKPKYFVRDDELQLFDDRYGHILKSKIDNRSKGKMIIERARDYKEEDTMAENNVVFDNPEVSAVTAPQPEPEAIAAPQPDPELPPQHEIYVQYNNMPFSMGSICYWLSLLMSHRSGLQDVVDHVERLCDFLGLADRAVIIEAAKSSQMYIDARTKLDTTARFFRAWLEDHGATESLIYALIPEEEKYDNEKQG